MSASVSTPWLYSSAVRPCETAAAALAILPLVDAAPEPTDLVVCAS
jgi:hypothetical protein